MATKENPPLGLGEQPPSEPVTTAAHDAKAAEMAKAHINAGFDMIQAAIEKALAHLDQGPNHRGIAGARNSMHWLLTHVKQAKGG